MVSGLRDEPSLDVLAGWLATRIDGPVQRAVGELKVDLVLPSETITLRRPQTGVTATLTRTSRPEARIPLARREAKECLAEDLRRWREACGDPPADAPVWRAAMATTPM